VTGFAQRNASAGLCAVGAVYDRAVFAIKCDKRAVVDRAYSAKWAANFPLCKARVASALVVARLHCAVFVIKWHSRSAFEGSRGGS
jgi:hypothetical protein